MHALEQGAKTIQVRSVDTDVVVILAGTFHDLIATHPLADIWVAFGMGKNYMVFSHKRHLCKPGEAKITSITCMHEFPS